MSQQHGIILYLYPFSPYARRIVWYLNLRGIPYSQCLQPAVMPRPDLAAIGTVYRRIPVLAIGRDVYNDTRLILRKLEELYPDATKISASAPDQKAIERLLEHWAIDNGLFLRAAQLIPSPKLVQGERRKMRPEALVDIKSAFDLLETSLLADGREWILKTSGPSLADIEAVWPFHWLSGLRGALPADYVSAKHFPKVFAWIQRFDASAKQAATKMGKPKSLKGPEAVEQISKSQFAEPESQVEADDPTGLKKGQEIEVWPIDSGFNHKDRGKLVGLSGAEIVIESKTQSGQSVRVHTPRHGFRLRGVGGGSNL